MQGVCVAYDVVVHMKIDLYKRTTVSTIHLCKCIASFPGLLSPNAVEGLVKLLCRMTSGGRLEVWHFQ